MPFKVGDAIVAESEKAAQTGRTGIVEEVLQEDPPRLRVQWEDGHTSVLTPQAGSTAVRHAPAQAKASRR
jgi:hypothetical protein